VPASTQYFVKETTNNLWRNRLMTLAAILTVGVSLALAGSALLLRQGVSSASSELRGGVPLTIFMNADATPGQLVAVRSELQRDSEVKSIRFYGKAQSFAEFKRMFAGEPDLLHSVTENDLPLRSGSRFGTRRRPKPSASSSRERPASSRLTTPRRRWTRC
jgi:cell division transport system permease protein